MNIYFRFDYMPLRFLVLFIALFTSFNSSSQTLAGESSHYMPDPIEPVNRLIWDFNYYILDDYIYRPVTETYVDWIPKGGRVAISNMVLNLEEPSSIVNNLIQLEFKHAGDALFRFAFNSSFGVLGLFDIAKYGGVERRRESFSNVLGNWHVPHGPYLMVPFIGPRSTRKLVGSIVDGLYFPGSYFSIGETTLVWGLGGLDVREGLLGQEVLIQQSLDPYTFVKEAYIQFEAFQSTSKTEGLDAFIELKEESNQQQTDQELSDFMDEID